MLKLYCCGTVTVRSSDSILEGLKADMHRYALYFTPSADSVWGQSGSQWLGRDAISDEAVAQPTIPGIPKLLLSSLTSEPRRYGFHATLKAPFRLLDGFDEGHLLEMAQAFCATQKPINIDQPCVRPLNDFLALQASDQAGEVAALAMRCVSYFDLLRSPLNNVELARRRFAGLSAREEALLQRWGYPYTEELFRFHMSLSNGLAQVDDDVSYAIRKAAEQHFAQALAGTPLVLDGLTIARESMPGAPFISWQRIPFSAQSTHATLPKSGRVFFCVGPSGVGKDALLNWVQQHFPGNDRGVFAKRVITRAAHPSELHEAVDVATFWQLAASGQFTMVWQANDLCYGIRRGVEADLKAGRDVIINGSRAYIPQLRQAFPDATVIWIEANETLIRERLEMRQRETGPALLKRLKRGSEFIPPDGQQVIRVDNSGPLEVAGKRLLEILQGED